jgi:hypothetical protein
MPKHVLNKQLHGPVHIHLHTHSIVTHAQNLSGKVRKGVVGRKHLKPGNCPLVPREDQRYMMVHRDDLVCLADYESMSDGIL